MPAQSTHILWFKEIDQHDRSIVGEKGAQLGDLTQAGFPIPNGFVLTSHAYFQFFRDNKLAPKITAQLSTINFDLPESVMQVSKHIKKLIMDADISENLLLDIDSAYNALGKGLDHPLVVLRSSATVANHPSASFAGHTFLNVYGEANLILKIKESWTSLFEPLAILERHKKHFDHFRMGSVIVVQKMIQSDTSGVMTTVNPVTNDKNTITIEAIYGLNDLLIKGEVTADHYEVDKTDLSIRKETVANQIVMLTRQGHEHKEVLVPTKDGDKQKLSKNQILDLAVLGKKLERHAYFPQSIEWAIEKNKISIIQIRSITPTTNQSDTTRPSERLQLILKGSPASPGMATGMVRMIETTADLGRVMPGEIVVTSLLSKEGFPVLKKAAALIESKGSRLTHTATNARAQGIPAVVGAIKALALLRTGMVITVNGTTGEIYRSGMLGSSISETLTSTPQVIQTATKVFATVDRSARKELDKIAGKHLDGIGLLDADFLLKEIGTHPKAIVHDNRHREFVLKLADQLEIYCKVMHPHRVLYRISDMETHDYHQLAGGEAFEPLERNPLLGFRGAARHIQEPEIFELELYAIKRVRDKKDFKNLSVIIPFVRTVQELTEMKRLIANAGLHRSPTFKLWMSIDLPANVLMLEKFIEIGIDGLVIGADHLAMLLLGTDKQNHHMAKDFDELNPAVLETFQRIIQTAHKHHLPVSVYGQALSIHPELLEKLVTWGITSVSVLPEDVIKVREQLSQFERKLIIKS